MKLPPAGTSGTRGAVRRFSLCAIAALSAATIAAAAPQAPLVVARQGWMYVGGHIETHSGKQYMVGQMYVEFQIPQKRTHAVPLILVHSGVSGVFFTGTPDGREGWAQYFLRQGYAVYVVDRPGRGRSRYLAESYGILHQFEPEHGLAHFVAQEKYLPKDAMWPQANLHTQWPGTGERDDPAALQVMQAELQEIQDPKDQGHEDVGTQQRLLHAGLVALVEKLGPSILLGYSGSTVAAWSVADAKPELVKAIVAVGPSGPPAHAVIFTGPPNFFKYGDLVRPWGLAFVPLTYSPAVTKPSELSFVQEEKADGPDLVRCYVQAEPARKLSNLDKVPVAIVTPEASDHAPYDHCTAKYLRQAGVNVNFIRLSDIGIHGNGDAMMWEKNSNQIAGVIARWLQKTVAGEIKK